MLKDASHTLVPQRSPLAEPSRRDFVRRSVGTGRAAHRRLSDVKEPAADGWTRCLTWFKGQGVA